MATSGMWQTWMSDSLLQINRYNLNEWKKWMTEENDWMNAWLNEWQEWMDKKKWINKNSEWTKRKNEQRGYLPFE